MVVEGKIRLVLSDDHTILRQGLRSMLNSEQDILVVGEASNGREAIKVVNELQPDILIIDISMPGLNGVQTAKMLQKSGNKVKIIALSIFAETNYVRQMIAAGVRGYLCKSCDFVELLEAIRRVHSGSEFVTKDVMVTVLNDYRNIVENLDQSENLENKLSLKELEILQMLVEGLSCREIGEKINLSTKTADSHRSNIMKKLKIGNIAELTKYALKTGITHL